jgi:hypothetical protein
MALAVQVLLEVILWVLEGGDPNGDIRVESVVLTVVRAVLVLGGLLVVPSSDTRSTAVSPPFLPCHAGRARETLG